MGGPSVPSFHSCSKVSISLVLTDVYWSVYIAAATSEITD
jgi:hypothetical protein